MIDKVSSVAHDFAHEADGNKEQHENVSWKNSICDMFTLILIHDAMQRREKQEHDPQTLGLQTP